MEGNGEASQEAAHHHCQGGSPGSLASCSLQSWGSGSAAEVPTVRMCTPYASEWQNFTFLAQERAFHQRCIGSGIHCGSLWLQIQGCARLKDPTQLGLLIYTFVSRCSLTPMLLQPQSSILPSKQRKAQEGKPCLQPTPLGANTSEDGLRAQGQHSLKVAIQDIKYCTIMITSL